MITSIVSGHHALVRLGLQTPNSQHHDIDFVLDTGFAGYLTLPPSVISALALSFVYRIPASLADGSRILIRVYESTVLWDGNMRSIEVLATSGEPLLGTSLLDGHEVSIQFTDGGLVTVEPL